MVAIDQSNTLSFLKGGKTVFYLQRVVIPVHFFHCPRDQPQSRYTVVESFSSTSIMLHIVFYTLKKACFAKNAPAVTELDARPDKPIATPSAILSIKCGFRRNLAPSCCRFLLRDTRLLLPISLHMSAVKKFQLNPLFLFG